MKQKAKVRSSGPKKPVAAKRPRAPKVESGEPRPGKDIDPLAVEIGAAIAAAIKASKYTGESLAHEMGMTGNGMKQIKAGRSCAQYAQLARMAHKLGVTPNDLLGFNDKSVLSVALQTVLAQIGLPEREVAGLTQIVLKVTSSPPAHSATMSREDVARVRAEDATREFYRQ